MRRVISFILILVITSQSFLFALPTQASIKGAGIEFSSCAGGNIIGGLLAQKIQGAIARRAKIRAEEAARRALERFAGSITTVPVLDQSAIKQLLEVQLGVDTTNTNFLNKTVVYDILARCAARTILNNMVSNIFRVMRTNGRDGGVTFIRNWNTFQAQAQYRGENIFRAELSTAQLCGYLSDGIKKSFGVDPKKQTPIRGQSTRTDSLQTFGLSAKCTLPTDFTLQGYQQNFSGNGGWDAWSRLLEPQNNAWGLVALSQNEIAKQRALAVSADTNQALAGGGYLGTSGQGKTGSCAVKSPSGADCIVYNDIKTTGSFIKDNVAAGINAELTWITSAQSLGSIVATMTSVLLNRLLDQGNPDEDVPRVANETAGVDIDSVSLTPPDPLPAPAEPPPDTCGAPLPIPTGPAPNMIVVVQRIAAEFPGDLAYSCQDAGGTWNFMDKVVESLRTEDGNWGYNGKRGDVNNLSQDAISYRNEDGTGVSIVDIIAGHCGDNPQATWNDVTAETYQCGVTGAYVYPRSGAGANLSP